MMDPYKPIASPLLFQQLENGLSIHVWRRVKSSNVQNCGSQVNVQHHMRVSEKVYACSLLSFLQINIYFEEPRGILENTLQCIYCIGLSCYLHCPWLHIGSSKEERYTDVKIIRHRLALDQPKLTDVVAMICCVDDVSVV